MSTATAIPIFFDVDWYISQFTLYIYVTTCFHIHLLATTMISLWLPLFTFAGTSVGFPINVQWIRSTLDNHRWCVHDIAMAVIWVDFSRPCVSCDFSVVEKVMLKCWQYTNFANYCQHRKGCMPANLFFFVIQIFTASPPRQNGCHFTDIYKCISMNEKFGILSFTEFCSHGSNWQ